MNDPDDQKAGKLTVIDGGKYPFRGRRRGPRPRSRQEIELDRRMHTAITHLTDPFGNVPDKRTYRIREGEGWPWRVLGRAVMGWYRRRVKRDQVKAVFRALETWVDDVYDGKLDRPEDRAA